MKTYIFILFFILFPSLLFSQNKKNKLYGKCSGFVCTQVELKNTGDFNLFIFNDVGGGHIVKGTYMLNTDTIIVNTYEQPKHAVNIVKEEYDSLLLPKQNKIYIFDCDSNKIPAQIFVMTNLKIFEDYKNEFLIIADSINNIDFDGPDPGQSGIYYPKNKKSNSFKIYFKEADYSTPFPRYLTNEKWLLKDDKLYLWKNKQGSFDTSRYLMKTKNRHKAF